MKKYALLCAAAMLLSMGVVGCSNTAQGVSEDAAQNGQKAASAANDAADATKKAADNAADATKKAAENVGDATKKAAENVGDATKKAAESTAATATAAGSNATAALEVTPKVKLAIAADKELNDTKNTINVDSKDGVVHLKGTVYNNSLKKKAGMIAEKTLKDMNATDKVMNELTVTSH
jgi:predicted small secreted protein